MSFRGRGRGRGFGGRGFGGGSNFKFVVPQAYELFPERVLPDRNNVPEEKKLAVFNFKFRNYFKSSPYHLEETCSEEDTVDIERFSDKANSKSRSGRESLLGSGYLKLEPGYFPIELVRGTKFKKKKVDWNRRKAFKMDFLEELEKKKGEGKDAKGKKDKEGKGEGGEGEEEEEEEEDVEGEEEDEVDSDDDYAKGFDYDDDEDDYNMDDGDDEATM